MDQLDLDIVVPLRKPLAERYGAELTAGLLGPDTSVKLLAGCGIPLSGAGETFPNPYYQFDENPAASLWAGAGGTYALWYHHGPGGGEKKNERILLGQLYRDIHVGLIDEIKSGGKGTRWRKLSGYAAGLWLIRLAADVDLIELPAVEAQPLRMDVPAHVQKLYDGIVLLSACRQRYDPENVNFQATKSFFADWSNMTSESDFVGGKQWLFRHGYLQVVQAGEWKGGGGGKATEYRFGTSAEVAKFDKAAGKKEAAADVDNRREAALRMDPSRPELLDDEQREAYNALMRERAGRA